MVPFVESAVRRPGPGAYELIGKKIIPVLFNAFYLYRALINHSSVGYFAGTVLRLLLKSSALHWLGSRKITAEMHR
jgi:hypothetical protein